MSHGKTPITDRITAAKKALGEKTKQVESQEVVKKPAATEKPKAQTTDEDEQKD